MIREVISDGFCYGERYNNRVNEGTIIKVNALVKTPNSQSKLSFVVEHIDGHPEMKGKYVDIRCVRNGYSVSKEFDLDYLEKNDDSIKPYELKLWQVFYNNNDFLSIVYNMDKNNLYILNYNGTLYTVNWRNESSQTKYRKSDINAQRFFDNYPLQQLIRVDGKYGSDREKTYNAILKSFNKSGDLSSDTDSIITIYVPPNKKLLLL